MEKEKVKIGEREKPCANCKEMVMECRCIRNRCIRCGEAVGNITFTVCDDCWDIKHNKQKSTENYGYWGKFYTFTGEKEPRMVWVGEMSESEMRAHFSDYRHNFRPSALNSAREEKWNSVEECLPLNDGSHVLMTVVDGDDCYVTQGFYADGWYDAITANKIGGEWNRNARTVAWKPLPEPYEEGEGK